MASELLVALPALHGIVIGVGAAFISAHFIPARAMIQDSEDRIKEIHEDIARLVRPDTYNRFDKYGILNSNGSLDWSGKVKPRILEIINFIKNGLSELQNDNPGSDVIALSSELVALLDLVCVTYPFDGAVFKFDKEETVTEKYGEAISAIRNRMEFINAMWNSYGGILIELGNDSDRAWIKKQNDHNTALRAKQLAQPSLTLENIGRINEFFDSRMNPVPNYSDKLQAAFGRFQSVSVKLDELQNSFDAYRRVATRYSYKKQLGLAIWLLAWVFISGILMPLVLVGLDEDFCIGVPRYVPLLMLLISACPYFYYWYQAFSSVRTIRLN